jgi:hypothetical protein
MFNQKNGFVKLIPLILENPQFSHLKTFIVSGLDDNHQFSLLA